MRYNMALNEPSASTTVVLCLINGSGVHVLLPRKQTSVFPKCGNNVTLVCG